MYNYTIVTAEVKFYYRFKAFMLVLLLFTVLLNFSSIRAQSISNTQVNGNNPNESNSNNEFINCGEQKCVASQGVCQEAKSVDFQQKKQECWCFPEYATLENQNKTACNYQRKSQLSAFLLELILSNGAGHFYLGNFYMAIPKLLLWVFSYYFFIILRIVCKGNDENNKLTFFLAMLALIFCLGMLTWQIFDIVFFALNKYTDKNGISLKPWLNTNNSSDDL